MRPAPEHPASGTDAARMLAELARVYPETAWDLNYRLRLTAHSRATDLRALGWNVESVRGRRLEGTRKYQWGYRLILADEHGQTFLETEGRVA